MNNSMYFIDSVSSWTDKISVKSKLEIQKLSKSFRSVAINQTELMAREEIAHLSSVFPKAQQLRVASHLKREIGGDAHPKLYICLEGRALASLSGQNEEVRAGQALLVPKSERPLHFYGPKAKLLEINLPWETSKVSA